MGITHNIWAFAEGIFNALYATLGNGVFVVIPLLLIVGTIAMGRLFEKAGFSGWYCIVPVYNIIIFLRIVGRPGWHILLFLIPVYNIYLLFKVHFELVQSFGRHDILDYVLLVVFNIFYIMNLGLSYEINYYGPAYLKSHPLENSKLNKGSAGAHQVA